MGLSCSTDYSKVQPTIKDILRHKRIVLYTKCVIVIPKDHSTLYISSIVRIGIVALDTILSTVGVIRRLSV